MTNHEFEKFLQKMLPGYFGVSGPSQAAGRLIYEACISARRTISIAALAVAAVACAGCSEGPWSGHSEAGRWS